MASTSVLAAVTTRYGRLHTMDNRLLLDRIRVNADTSTVGLLNLLGH
ncbi:hypothetical protein HC928_06045 [bacterium]|nr:hypothetical protein [bacterium]